jgi:hypothetical protein
MTRSDASRRRTQRGRRAAGKRLTRLVCNGLCDDRPVHHRGTRSGPVRGDRGRGAVVRLDPGAAGRLDDGANRGEMPVPPRRDPRRLAPHPAPSRPCDPARRRHPARPGRAHGRGCQWLIACTRSRGRSSSGGSAPSGSTAPVRAGAIPTWSGVTVTKIFVAFIFS